MPSRQAQFAAPGTSNHPGRAVARRLPAVLFAVYVRDVLLVMRKAAYVSSFVETKLGSVPVERWWSPFRERGLAASGRMLPDALCM
jgi:hypothetical protein